MNKRDLQQRTHKKQDHHSPDKSPSTDASPGVENASLLELQRAVGNQAVQRMVANGRLQGRGNRFNGLPPVRGTKDHIYRSPALQIRHSLKNMPIKKLQRVTTWAGDFTTDKYDTVTSKKSKKDIGVDIDLRFKPNKHVNAKKFAFTQMVQSMDAGEPFFIKNSDTDSKIVQDRSIPDDDPGEGSHIDRLTSKRSPLYATDNPADEATGGLADAPSTGNSKQGWHYKDDDGKLLKEDAWMHDKPTLPNRGKNASQKFETTVLATDGTQQGTYYGSVSWGWETDGTGAFTKLPLAEVSKDVPTGTFAEATKLWNESKTSDGKDVLDLPIVSGKYTNYPRVWLVSNPSKYKSTIMSKLDKNTRVEVTGKGDEERFNQTTDKYKWWKVTAVSGDAIGQVGWVMQHFLSDAESK